MTSPIEYQRNHVGGGGQSGPPSSSSSTGGLPGGSSTNNASNMGGGGGGSGGNSSSLCGPRSRPSRIPQPSSRLPQPVHHHHPPGPEGLDRSAGMWSPCAPHPSYPSSDSTANGDTSASEGPKLSGGGGCHGSNCNSSNKPPDRKDGTFRPGVGGLEESQKPQKAAVPRMTVAPLSFPLKSSRVGTISPLISPPTPGGGKELYVPSSPSHKGNPFWAVVPPMPPSPASRPASLSFPSDTSGGGDSLGRGGGVAPSFHRSSNHSKDVDRMSTCSSTSEQSVTSTQSNGVRSRSGPGPDSSPLLTTH